MTGSRASQQRYRARRPARPAHGSARRRRHASNGFSLIEALVALVVLSVGMIGIAAMYGQGLNAGRSAQLRTQAVNLVADMTDRIRVNRLGRAAYAGPAANNGCDPQTGSNDCTPAEMAAHDLFAWQAQLAERLPNGVGRVSFDASTTPPTYTIEVSWDDGGQGRQSHEAVIRVPEI